MPQIVVCILFCQSICAPNLNAQNANCPSEQAPDSEGKKLSGPEVSISSVTFSGVSRLPISDQDHIASWIKEESHGSTVDGLVEEALERVRAGWQNHGYFKVEVSDDASTVTSTPLGQQVVLSVHVDEGLKYNLGKITFKNNTKVTNASALRALFPIKDGEILGREKIAKGLENLRKAYGTFGFINFTAVPETTFDDERKLAFLEIDIDEGQRFYLTRVDIIGLEEPSRQEVLKDMGVGEIYSQKRFDLALKKHASELRFLHDDPSHVAKRIDEKMGTVEIFLDARPCTVN